MKSLQLLYIFGLSILVSCTTQKKSGTPYQLSQQEVNKKFENAAAQYKVMINNLPAGRFPKTYDSASGKLVTSGSDWWCSGFYPGTLLYLYEQLHDKTLYNEAQRMLGLLQKEQFNKGTHDLGFMMYCSFGNAYRITHDEHDKEILIQSARSLSTRFNPKVGCIKSWDSRPSDFLVIIDNMMNLELLFWATKLTGDSSFYHIATTHANTTIKNHFRKDYSSYHVVNYDPETGSVKQRRTAQGAADESAWARGQAWGLYGFTVCYRETKDTRYLDQARHIAQFILSNPTLPADKIPYWDYNAPGIPNALRDASAASIMASAFLELSQYVKSSEARDYTNVAKIILQQLSSDRYKAATGSNGGFILKHSVGNMPQKSEVDVPLTYADYYYIEALKRFKESGIK